MSTTMMMSDIDEQVPTDHTLHESSSPTPTTTSTPITTTTVDLKLYENKLSEYDSIMHPNVIQLLSSYISSGGDPSVAITKLINGYKGYAQMSNLILSWMTMIGFDKQELNDIIVQFLKSEIREHFDAKKADAIFMLTNNVPQWLDFMISHSDWRSFIYEMSEKYPHCVLLSFAIQRISELGHHSEITSVTSASSSFRVFHRVLGDALDNLITVNEDMLDHSSAFHDFKKVCCFSEHTYIHAQCYLQTLIKNVENGALFKRLSEELEAHLIREGKTTETSIRKICLLFSEYDYRLAEVQQQNNQRRSQMSDVATALLSMLTAHATNPADISKIHKCYTSPNPPPVSFLHHPDIFQLFINDLFDPSKKIPLAHQIKYIHVLALAASTSDNDITRQQQRMNEITQGLQATIQVCTNKNSPLNLTKSVSAFRKYMGINIVALGVLHWITVVFADSEHSVSVYTMNNTKMYMALLKEIAYLHVPLRPNVLDVVHKCFEMKNDLDALHAVEIKRVYVEVFMYLLQLGYVIPTMQTLNRIVKDQLDLALIRSIVSQLIEMTEEPYSEQFVDIFVDILCTNHAVDSLKKISSTLRPFVQHLLHSSVHKAHLLPPNLKILSEYMQSQ